MRDRVELVDRIARALAEHDFAAPWETISHDARREYTEAAEHVAEAILPLVHGDEVLAGAIVDRAREHELQPYRFASMLVEKGERDA